MRRPARTRFLVALVALVGVSGCGRAPEVETREQGLTVCASGPTLEGIDVSHWQGTIDWDQVSAAGIKFAFVRVSDGTTTMDSRFQYNWSEAQRVGIIRGVYQFFRPSQDPVAQANIVINALGGAMTPGDLPPVIDVETGSGLSKSTVAARVRQWLDRVESALGVRPIIYTSPGVWATYVNSSAFSDYLLWVAHYYVACPTMPTGWSAWLFHQYTDSGTVAGINTNSVDRNRFNGDMAALQALTWGDPVCGDGVCTSGEDGVSCPGDCPTCQPVPAEGRVLDDSDLCLELEGDAQYWRTEAAGYAGRLIWTHTTSTQAYNVARWSLTFDVGGWYRVEAYTAAPWAESRQAKYRVTHGGVTDVVPVDQTAANGWNEVAVLEFAAGGGQGIVLQDLTGEPGSTNTQLVVDAIRLVPVAAPSGCETVPAQGRTMEEDDACVELGGDPQYWRTESAGSAGRLLWTHTVSSQVYNYVVWKLAFQQAGKYLVEAYTAAPWAESRKAKYRVTHGGVTNVITVDQTLTNGWARVGEFDFAAGGDQRVRLEDLTGEPGSTNTQLVVDAIRLTRIEIGYGGTPSEDGEDSTAQAGASEALGDPGDPADPGTPSDGSDSAGFRPDIRTEMACNTSPEGPGNAPFWLLLVPLVIVWLRKRR